MSMHGPSAVAAPLVTSLLGNWWDQNVLTFSMSPFFLLLITQKAAGIFPLSLSHIHFPAVRTMLRI